MSIEATIAITADWLCKHKPVVFTNRTKDQPQMTDPFKDIYQQVVKDNKQFFKDVHDYTPDPNSKSASSCVDPGVPRPRHLTSAPNASCPHRGRRPRDGPRNYILSEAAV